MDRRDHNDAFFKVLSRLEVLEPRVEVQNPVDFTRVRQHIPIILSGAPSRREFHGPCKLEGWTSTLRNTNIVCTSSALVTASPCKELGCSSTTDHGEVRRGDALLSQCDYVFFVHSLCSVVNCNGRNRAGGTVELGHYADLIEGSTL